MTLPNVIADSWRKNSTVKHIIHWRENGKSKARTAGGSGTYIMRSVRLTLQHGPVPVIGSRPSFHFRFFFFFPRSARTFHTFTRRSQRFDYPFYISICLANPSDLHRVTRSCYFYWSILTACMSIFTVVREVNSCKY